MGMVAILVTRPFVQTFVPPSYWDATWNLALTIWTNFIFPIHNSCTWNLALMDPAASQQRMFESINLSDLGKRSNNNLDLWYSNVFMYSVNYLYQLSVQRLHLVSTKSSVFKYFPYKRIREQIGPCCKIGQGQPRITIWSNSVGPDSLMLYTKFECHPPAGFREKDF